MHSNNLKSDADRVRQLLDEYRAGGLAVVTVSDIVKALDQGQIDELLITVPAVRKVPSRSIAAIVPRRKDHSILVGDPGTRLIVIGPG